MNLPQRDAWRGWMDRHRDEHNSQTAGLALRRVVTLASPLAEEEEVERKIPVSFYAARQGAAAAAAAAGGGSCRLIVLQGAAGTSQAKQPQARAPSRERAQVAQAQAPLLRRPRVHAALGADGAGRRHARTRGPIRRRQARRARRAPNHVSRSAGKVGWPERRAQGRRERGAKSRAEAVGRQEDTC